MEIAGVSNQMVNFFDTNFQQIQKRNDNFTCLVSTVATEIRKEENDKIIGLHSFCQGWTLKSIKLLITLCRK